MSEQQPKTCYACARAGMGPDDPELVCAHPDGGFFGVWARKASAAGGHCGPDRPKSEQHPARNPDGSLKRSLPVST